LEIHVLLNLWDKIRKQTYYILAFSLHQVCHQEVPMLEENFQIDINEHVKKLNTYKQELVYRIPRLMYNMFKIIFKNTKGQDPQLENDTKWYYKQIKNFLYDQKRTPENLEEWEYQIVDMIDSSEDLKVTLEPERALIMSKR